MLKKAAGIVILVATIGVAGCQALFIKAPGIDLPLGNDAAVERVD